jgi:hypothetical protein
MEPHVGEPTESLGILGWGRDFECNGLIYIRGCQEHFSPSAGGAGLVRDIQPL